ncbi:MAG: acetolactate synthase small subunit [Bacteroidales bacterium]|nr:acetolactate synthase small subunit [Bacteroidales bacterium]
MKETFTITAFSENHIGLLNRITIIFTRRRVNIDTLTVSPSAIKGVHKFTITVFETHEMVEKVVKQIDKVVDVIKAFYHTDDEIIFQELALYKVSTDILLNSNQVENIVRKSSGRIVEVTPTYTVIEKMGTAEETQELFEELNKLGILQFTRSGRIAVTRLSEELLHNFLKERNLLWK